LRNLHPSQQKFPLAGLLLGVVICVVLVLCGESNGDPDVTTGVASVFPETGTWPFATARAQILEIDAGIEPRRDAPLLTLISSFIFTFFGSDVGAMKVLPALSFLAVVLLVTVTLARRYGEGAGILLGLIVALQPTLLPWASVPNVVPLAAFCVLALTLLAGSRYRWGPWLALGLCGLLSWGLTPLILMAAPPCWIEGLRRITPHRLRPEGWVLTVLVAATIVSLRQVGADPIALASGLTGCFHDFQPGAVPGILEIDPGWLIAVVAALIAGPRGRDARFRPLRVLLVAGLLPWVVAGTLPVFPLVVLIPAGLLYIANVLAQRSGSLTMYPVVVRRGSRVALTLFVLGCLMVASFTSALSDGPSVRIGTSLAMAMMAVGVVLALRAGMRSQQAIWIAVATTVALSLPVNLHRIGHEQQLWETSREELVRILPQGASIGGRWALALTIGSQREARLEGKSEHQVVVEGSGIEGLHLESYALCGEKLSLIRSSGTPYGVFEVACALQASGMRSEARTDLALLLRADPTCSAAWERFAILLLEDGIEDLAVECLFFSLHGNPHRASTHRELARLYARRGMLRESLHHMLIAEERAVLSQTPIPWR